MFVFCTDGIFEALNEGGEEFGATRVCEIVERHRHLSARGIVDAIFESVTDFRGARPGRRHDRGGGEDSQTVRRSLQLRPHQLVALFRSSSWMCRPIERPPNDAT